MGGRVGGEGGGCVTASILVTARTRHLPSSTTQRARERSRGRSER